MKTVIAKVLSFTVIHEFVINAVAPLLVAFVFDLTIRQALLLVFGSFLVDIDHILHCVYKGVGWKDMKKYLQAEFALHRPHIYIFHVLEVLIALILMSYFFFPSFLFLFLGFALNVIIDILTYLLRHRSFSPWGRFFFGSYNLYYLRKLRKMITSKTQQE